ncbi:RraA family protein [Alicyclobacillus curvatus]|nr:RraA family protein [Alicyclobacillus curvatus]
MDIVDQFKDIPTTCISDAMQGLNNLDPVIKPLKPQYRVAGRARTVKLPVGDNLVLLKAIRESRPGEVIVVDTKGDLYRAIAGDFVLGMAQILGLGGIVADGAIRDIEGTKQLDFPVFCRGATVAAGGKAGTGEINVPISCGGVSVSPGDIIVGDADGVLVVPQRVEEELLKRSLEKQEFELKRAYSVLVSPEDVRKYLDNILPQS